MDKAASVDISFVVIGYNESEHLPKCLASVQEVRLENLSCEIIYVDGGSQDNSIELAKAAGVDIILGGDRRRKAAENRNLGFKHSTGRYVQFIDGDMVIHADWPRRAVDFLATHDQTAAVCGNIREVNQSPFYQALQLDWSEKEGEIDSCGGSAMWRREALKATGGFPEDVAFGEEPYLCWRVRNELGMNIFYLTCPMVEHDLDYSGFRDYWRRNVRCGETYAEISQLCFNTEDRLWLGVTISNLAWSTALIFAFVLFFLSPLIIKTCIVGLMSLILFRKTMQMLLKKNNLSVAIIYALHAYFFETAPGLG